MVLLPAHPRRAWLRSFWLALSLIWLGFIGIPAMLFGTPFLPWAAVAVLLCVPVVIRPQIVTLPYRAWNKLSRIYIDLAERLLLKICYFTIVVPTAWTGSRLTLDKHRT